MINDKTNLLLSKALEFNAGMVTFAIAHQGKLDDDKAMKRYTDGLKKMIDGYTEDTKAIHEFYEGTDE